MTFFPNLVGRFVDFSDPPVSRFDVEADEVDTTGHVRAEGVAVAPHLFRRIRAFHVIPPGRRVSLSRG
jgi:hypothetical protein